MTDLLTPDELHAMNVTAQLVNALHDIVGQGPSREDDLTELVGHVHNIQHAVMGQAAARAYPERFRLLGEDHTDSGVDDVALPAFLEPQLPLGHFLDGSQEPVMHLADERGMALCTGRPFDALQAAFPVPTCPACMAVPQEAPRVQHLVWASNARTLCTGVLYDTRDGDGAPLCPKCALVRDGELPEELRGRDEHR